MNASEVISDQVGIERRMSEIRTGSKPAVGPPGVELPPKPPVPAELVGDASERNEPVCANADSSRRNFFLVF